MGQRYRERVQEFSGEDVTAIMRQLLQTVLPEPLVGWMRSSPALYQLRNRRAASMTVGPGRGLLFAPGPSNSAYASGGNELPVQEALERHLRPGAVFYDVGANVGFFSVIGARLVGNTGVVYAFEPVPENATYVRLNARLNRFRNIKVVEKAVSRCSGAGELWLAGYSGGSSLTLAPPDARRRLAVKLVSIDDLVYGQGQAVPAVLKIDVEGAEIDVLRGMSRTLAEIKPAIVYEIDDERRDAYDEKCLECENLLRGFGYRVEPLKPSYPDIEWIVGHFLAMPA
jgi:FkbM family methyltransferase